MEVIFNSAKHRDAFDMFCGKMKYLDCYHEAVAYLLALDVVLREYVDEVFNFEDDVIIPEGLSLGFQTGTSKATTRLLFNLWNGYTGSDSEYDRVDYYSVADIFCRPYAPYYWQAIRIRYPEYANY